MFSPHIKHHSVTNVQNKHTNKQKKRKHKKQEKAKSNTMEHSHHSCNSNFVLVSPQGTQTKTRKLGPNQSKKKERKKRRKKEKNISTQLWILLHLSSRLTLLVINVMTTCWVKRLCIVQFFFLNVFVTMILPSNVSLPFQDDRSGSLQTRKCPETFSAFIYLHIYIYIDIYIYIFIHIHPLTDTNFFANMMFYKETHKKTI